MIVLGNAFFFFFKRQAAFVLLVASLALASCTGTVQELKEDAKQYVFTMPGRYDQLGLCYYGKQRADASVSNRYGGSIMVYEFHDPIRKVYRVTYAAHTPFVGSKPITVTEFMPAGEGKTKVIHYGPKPIINLGGDLVERMKKQLADCQQFFQ